MTASGDVRPLRPLAPDLSYPAFATADQAPSQGVHAHLPRAQPHPELHSGPPDPLLDRGADY